MGFAWVSGSASADVSDTRATALVDDHTIRNQYLEVEIDPISGGIKSLRDHTVRVPQLGQQLLLVGCNNGGKSDDESPGPIRSSMRARSTSVVSAGPEYAGLAVEGELVADPCPSWTADPVVGRFRQTYWLGRNESVLRLVIEILEIDCDVFEGRASPWQCYLANRIAWPDSRSVLVRGVGTLSEVTRSQRPESPYFVEVHGRRNRVALITGGLPFHQRTGPRMLDTLLVTATEQCRRFELGFGIDLPNPFQAALDLITPAVMIARDGPPAVGAASWFVHLDVRNVVITSTTELGSDRSGIRLRLFESAGRYTRGRLRCFRNVAEARLTDFRGQRLATLDVQGDTVHLDLAPREITQLEVEFAVV
jgi:alpha-mannosidase